MIKGQSRASPRVSDILSDLVNAAAGDRVPVGTFVDALGERAFGLLQLVFSLPNAVGLGAVPGLSSVFGVPQMFLATQMIIGLQHPWLPDWLRHRSVARQDLQTLLVRAMPHLVRVERVLRPRLLALSSPLAERLLGLLFLVLAITVSLPIPFGNQPPAIAMALLSLGLIERDGVYILIGLLAAALAIAIAAAVVVAGAAVVVVLLHHLFGG